MESALDLVLKRTVASAKPQLAAKDLPRLTLLPGARGQHESRDSMRDPLRTMAVVVTIVLLVACANVANLLLARGRARMRELSVRAAIGAPRGRVVRQLFTEGALLAAFGAALGVMAAQWVTLALLPALTESSNVQAAALNWRVLAFVATVAAGCALAFGLAPALRSTRVTLTAGLQDAARRGTAGSSRGRFAGALVVVQIALSMTLVVTAGLLARSLRNLDRAELGFDPHGVLTFRLDPTLNRYEEARVRSLYAAVLDGLRASPGVLGATFTSHRLLSNSSSIGVASTEGEALPDPGSEPAQAFMVEHRVWRQMTGPRFFETMRVPILRGRALDERDGAGGQRAAIVNARLARQLFKTEDVVGRRFRMGLLATSPLYEIVGVAADARYTAVREGMPPTAISRRGATACRSSDVRGAGRRGRGSLFGRRARRREARRRSASAGRGADDGGSDRPVAAAGASLCRPGHTPRDGDARAVGDRVVRPARLQRGAARAGDRAQDGAGRRTLHGAVDGAPPIAGARRIGLVAGAAGAIASARLVESMLYLSCRRAIR